MRVSDSQINGLLTSYLMSGKDKVYSLQAKMASGKRVELPSDDPGAYELIRRMKDSNANLDQRITNGQSLSLDLTTIDSALDGVTSIIQRSMEISTTASDGTKTPADRIAFGKEVNMLLNQMIDLGNSHYGGHYIFAGLRTDHAPFTIETDGDVNSPSYGMVNSVTYQGNQGVRQVEIGKFVPGSDANRLGANVPGSDPGSINGAFETRYGSVFKTLMRLRDQLLNGQNPILTESTAITGGGPPYSTLSVSREYETGERVMFESTGDLPILTASGQPIYQHLPYFAVVDPLDPGNIKIAGSYEDAIAVPPVTLTFNTLGTGEHSIIKDAQGELSVLLDMVGSLRADVGARMQRVTLNENLLNTQKGTQDGMIAAKQDIDVASATLEMSQLKTSYEAALRIIANTMDLSLSNYI